MNSDNLPTELLAELSKSKAKKMASSIMKIIDAAGGEMSLDKILIAIYRETGEIYKRNKLISRLYRMKLQGLLFKVPGKKSIYRTSRPDCIECNLPFERVPQHASDPGFGPVPPESNVVSLIDVVADQYERKET